jgi:hypothetical protein
MSNNNLLMNTNCDCKSFMLCACENKATVVVCTCYSLWNCKCFDPVPPMEPKVSVKKEKKVKKVNKIEKEERVEKKGGTIMGNVRSRPTIGPSVDRIPEIREMEYEMVHSARRYICRLKAKGLYYRNNPIELSRLSDEEQVQLMINNSMVTSMENPREKFRFFRGG